MKRSSILLVIFVLAKITLQLSVLAQSGYDLFRDELYYLACANHLAWGYVDHPPFSIAVLSGWISITGDSLVSLRILAALIGAIPVAVVGLMTRQLGGGWKAQSLACIAVVFAPIQLGIASFYSMNVIEYALVLGMAWLLLRITIEGKSSSWIWFGIVLGIGIENKHTFAVLAAFLLIGLLFTPSRKEFLTKSFWIGIGIAALLALPNLIWQFTHNFVSLEFYRNASELKNVSTSPVKIILDQVSTNNPVTILLWFTGLLWFLRGKNHLEKRAFGIAFVLMLAMMMASQSNRPDRIASFVPVLVAGGAVVWERLSAKKYFRWIVPATAIFIFLFGVISLPIPLPILSPQRTVEYMQRHGIQTNFERGISSPLPQNLADRIGWKELADSVAAAVQRLPENERNSVVLVGQNYGEAGALEYYGRAHHLPRVISGQNSYWMWGPGSAADVYIVIGNSRSRMQQLFNNVHECGHTSDGLQMNYECHRSIWICRDPKVCLEEVWLAAKIFI
jgi:Dolichyl-phosphate-mannose-protein mannosyltransferase